MSARIAGHERLLEHVQVLDTSGARAVCSWKIDDEHYLAVPQLATDVTGEQPDMTRGNNDVATLIYSNRQGVWTLFQELDSQGGEDAEAFEIDGRHFLAIATFRRGNELSPYQYETDSTIYEFKDGRFQVFQQISTFAAKQWRYFSVSGQHFLALAQGATVEKDSQPAKPYPSKIFEWTGSKFDEFQIIDSKWGYNWATFAIGGVFYLAYADHAIPSVIYKWDGKDFVRHQELDGLSGRSFCYFEADGSHFLAFARLMSETVLLKWDGQRFGIHQVLFGIGGREFTLLQENGQTYVVQVNFISGSREAPITPLQSFIYQFKAGKLVVADTFDTCGGTDATVVALGQMRYLVISESLAPNVSFRTRSNVYRLNIEVGSTKESRDSTYQNPELAALFYTYTTSPAGVGAHLKDAASTRFSTEPLIVATGTDIALFPGDGRDPTFESFRFSTRGFKELTSVAHLGPAMASLVNMRSIDPGNPVWRDDLKRMLYATRTARSANSASLWSDKIQVEAYKGKEAAIAAMLDYGCALTVRFLETVLADETKATPEFLREAYLQGTDGSLGAVLPFNLIMLASFYLAGMDIAFRLTRWFRLQRIDWSRAEVLVCGKQGRPTSGVTWNTNSVCQMILGASDKELPLERMYIAPHGPSFTITDPTDVEAVRKFEQPMRALWCYTRAIAELGPTMFSDYPGYKPDGYGLPIITPGTKVLQEFPKVLGVTDIYSSVTRLRLVMEDPRQLLSGCLADLAVAELAKTGNDPQQVPVPGLTDFEYPTGLDDTPSSSGSWATGSYTARNAHLLFTISEDGTIP